MIWSKVMDFQLSTAEDKVGWKIGKKNKFTVKSTYDALTSVDSGHHFRHIWKGKIPARLMFFLVVNVEWGHFNQRQHDKTKLERQS